MDPSGLIGPADWNNGVTGQGSPFGGQGWTDVAGNLYNGAGQLVMRAESAAQNVTRNVEENPGLWTTITTSAAAMWNGYVAWMAEYAGAGLLTRIPLLFTTVKLAEGSAAAWAVGLGAPAAAAVGLGAFGWQAYQLYQEWPRTAPRYVQIKESNGQVTVVQVTAVDPNDLVGPAGYGSQEFVQPQGELPYQIDFENESDALAPAQTVAVTQQIDPNLDWSTFQLGSFGFGGQTYTVPAGRQYYSTRIDATRTVGVYVDVTADFDEQTGLLTWQFTSIDPTTLDQPRGNVLEGFLPPDKTAPQGQGWVSYFVQPRAADPTGTAINAQASVVFNTNAPIETKTLVNTIDAGAPTSTVAPLPPGSLPSFTVNWSGSDDPGGSGIASYDVYVSEDGGPFTPFLQGTSATSATFKGTAGHSYGFYSVATDNVGNVESTPSSAEATTKVLVTTTTSVQSSVPTSTYGDSLAFTATVAPGSPDLGLPIGTVQFIVDGVDFGPEVVLVNGQAVSAPTASLGAGPHTIAAIYSGDLDFFASTSVDVAQTVDPATLDVTASDQSMNHGDAVPALTYQLSGFVNGDGLDVVSGIPSLRTTATSTSSAGRYPIAAELGSLSAANYAFHLVGGMLVVHPKVVDVRAESGSRSISLLGLDRDLPFSTINAMDIIFSDDVSVDLGELSLTGVNVPTYIPSQFNYNPAGAEATWRLPSPLDVDRLMMALDGASFAGDPTNGVNHFELGFAVLPGDFDGNGTVDPQDLMGVRNEVLGTGDPSMIGWADFDGNGAVDLTDYVTARRRLGNHLP